MCSTIPVKNDVVDHLSTEKPSLPHLGAHAIREGRLCARTGAVSISISVWKYSGTVHSGVMGHKVGKGSYHPFDLGCLVNLKHALVDMIISFPSKANLFFSPRLCRFICPLCPMLGNSRCATQAPHVISLSFHLSWLPDTSAGNYHDPRMSISHHVAYLRSGAWMIPEGPVVAARTIVASTS